MKYVMLLAVWAMSNTVSRAYEICAAAFKPLKVVLFRRAVSLELSLSTEPLSL